MRRDKEIHFDEVIADSLRGGKSSKEQPIKSVIFSILWLLTLLVSLVALLRTIALGGLSHKYYYERALANVREEIPVTAPRGLISDRYGKPLVENKPIFSVFLRVGEMIKHKEEEKVFRGLEEILGINRSLIIENLRNFDLEKFSDLLIAQDITLNQAIALQGLNLASLHVEDDYKRFYTKAAFSHVVGYVGKTSREELLESRELTPQDTIGKAGLEAYYDSLLRGENGKKLIYRNIQGTIESIEKIADSQIGQELKTNIDGEFQEYFYFRFREGLRSLGRTSGVGIAMNPNNGEVLSLLSFPSFDANNIVEYLNDPREPLFNRATSGVYNPGSVIKPLHATAALKERVITPQKRIFSAGYIEIPNPFEPSSPSRFLDWQAHGWVDLYSAIARSSNVYFYEVGGGFEDQVGLGIERLIKYWQKFGLDKKTGIDLPGEALGFLANPEEKEKRTGDIWRIGDTYNVSIGQGDIALTPLRLLSSIMAIGNGGKAFRPHLLKDQKTELILDLSELEDEFKEVRRGLEDTVSKPYGTARLLSDLPVKVAAKTGTAQIEGNQKINALFVGYAPVKNPEIAILVLIENAREGSLNAVPIAKDVLQWYYENRIVKNL